MLETDEKSRCGCGCDDSLEAEGLLSLLPFVLVAQDGGALRSPLPEVTGSTLTPALLRGSLGWGSCRLLYISGGTAEIPNLQLEGSSSSGISGGFFSFWGHLDTVQEAEGGHFTL